ADKYDLRRHIRFGTTVTACEFDGARWHVRTDGGEETVVDFVITACGVLREPTVPEIEGLETFAGHAFHSVHWDDSAPVAGARVAGVGTGSTGVQLVAPLGGVASRLVH